MVTDAQEGPAGPTDRGGRDLRRSSDVASGALTGVAVLLLLGWLWIVVRAQQNAEAFSLGYSDGSEDVTLLDRIDLAFSSMHLLAYSGVLGGLAAAVRLLGRVTAPGAG